MEANITREQALALLREYNEEPFHIQHALMVEGVLRWYARELGCGADEEFWALAGLLHDMMNGIAFVTQPKNIARMKKDLPILFVSGDCDPVGEQGRGVIRAYKCFLKAGMKDVTIRIYPEGRHEMLNESNHEVVYADILRWLEAL